MILQALVVDDEEFARLDLLELARADRRIEIRWEAASLRAARLVLEASEPDVIFLDIELNGECGFELVSSIRSGTPLVFVTAHDQYATRAFEIEALDYLLKPVATSRFENCVSRAQAWLKSYRTTPPGCSNGESADRLLIKSGTRREFILLSDIVLVSSMGGNYTQVHRADGSQIDVRRTIKEWEALLPCTHFLRVHRAAIINTNYLLGVSRDSGGSLSLQLTNVDDAVKVSRRNFHAVETCLAPYLHGAEDERSGVHRRISTFPAPLTRLR